MNFHVTAGWLQDSNITTGTHSCVFCPARLCDFYFEVHPFLFYNAVLCSPSKTDEYRHDLESSHLVITSIDSHGITLYVWSEPL